MLHQDNEVRVLCGRLISFLTCNFQVHQIETLPFLQATYRRLLDAVDLDKLDENMEVLLDEYGQPVQRPRRTSMDVRRASRCRSSGARPLWCLASRSPWSRVSGPHACFSPLSRSNYGFRLSRIHRGFDWLLRTWLHAWETAEMTTTFPRPTETIAYHSSTSASLLMTRTTRMTTTTMTLTLSSSRQAMICRPVLPPGSQYLQGMQRQTRPATLGAGHFTWIIYTTLGGLVIGLIKIAPFMHFPRKPKGPLLK